MREHTERNMDSKNEFRPSDRFLWLSILFTVAVVVFFVIMGEQTRRCHRDIVNLYCAESSIGTGDNVELDKTITSLLQLELDKIQQGMVVLSVWAGVMMIVFLVFSLYSMHRSDELEKESHESLLRIKSESETIKNEANRSIEEVSNNSKSELAAFHVTIEQHKKAYEEMAANKEKEIEEKIAEYKDSLKKATADFDRGIQAAKSVLDVLSHDINEERLEDDVVDEESEIA